MAYIFQNIGVRGIKFIKLGRPHPHFRGGGEANLDGGGGGVEYLLLFCGRDICIAPNESSRAKFCLASGGFAQFF